MLKKHEVQYILENESSFVRWNKWRFSVKSEKVVVEAIATRNDNWMIDPNVDEELVQTWIHPGGG